MEEDSYLVYRSIGGKNNYEIMACKTQCFNCKEKIDRFSGKLINLSDLGLQKFYGIKEVQEFCKQPDRKHVTLCSECLIKLLGKPLRLSDLKVKNGRLMTSNVAYLLSIQGKLTDFAINKLKEQDKGGVLPYKLNEHSYISVLKDYIADV